MTTGVADTRFLAGLIQPNTLKARGFPKPSRVSVIFGTDHTGEEAYHVYLVFPDSTPDAMLAWSNVKAMVRWVRNRIWKEDGERRWPYVRVKRESDFLDPSS